MAVKNYISFFEKNNTQYIDFNIGKITAYGKDHEYFELTGFSNIKISNDRIIFNGKRLVTINDKGVIRAI